MITTWVVAWRLEKRLSKWEGKGFGSRGASTRGGGGGGEEEGKDRVRVRLS